MAGETNTDAVDRVLAETPAAPVDEVKVPAAELVKLRARASLADSLERDHAHTLSQAAITEATASARFASDVAASHARTLLRDRVVVRPGEDGRLAAFDRITGRPAAAALREAIDSDDFKMYISASHQGGGGGGNGTGFGSGPEGDAEAARLRHYSEVAAFKANSGVVGATPNGFLPRR